MRVLVAGATGNLGSEIVRALARRRGVSVVALVRDARKLGELRALVSEVREADLTRPKQVAGVCRGVDVVVSAVGLVGVPALFSRNTHWKVDFGGNLNLLRDAEREGVGKFVYVSVVGTDEQPRDPLRRAKHRVERALDGSEALESLIVRPTAYFQEVAHGFLEPARRGVAFVVNDGDAYIAPIHAKDVAEWVADNFREATGVVDVGGPENFTHEALARLCFDVLRKPPRILHVPQTALTAAVVLATPLPTSTAGELAFIRYAATHDLVAPPLGKRSIRPYLAARARRERGPDSETPPAGAPGRPA